MTVSEFALASSLVLLGGCRPPGVGAEDDTPDLPVETCEFDETFEGDLMVADETPPDNLRCLVEVTGGLFISDTAAVGDLTALARLEVVGGDLHVLRNQSLTSIEGLGRLRQVGGVLWIGENPVLTDTSGLGALESVTQIAISNNEMLGEIRGLSRSVQKLEILTIRNNPALLDLDALSGLSTDVSSGATLLAISGNDKLTSIAGLGDFVNGAQPNLVLRISENPELASLAGLDGVVELNTLELTDLPTIDELQGLAGLTRATNISIARNSGLSTLHGLGALSMVTGELQIGHCGSQAPNSNASLTSLAGLDVLASVFALRISGNEALVSIDSLASLAGSEMSIVNIQRNPELPIAEVQAFLASVTVTGSVETCENQNEAEPCDCVPD
jgi:hypothetical protein